jgi:hypothetical protein
MGDHDRAMPHSNEFMQLKILIVSGFMNYEGSLMIPSRHKGGMKHEYLMEGEVENSMESSKKDNRGRKRSRPGGLLDSPVNTPSPR